MPVVRVILFACAGFLLVSHYSPRAYAAECRSISPAKFNFGTVTAGEMAQTNQALEFQCNNYDSTPRYVRLCMNLTNTAPPQMNTVPSGAPLAYLVYSADDLSTDISANSGAFAERNIFLDGGQTNYTFYINLVAKIPSGQSGLQAGDYYDAGTPATVKYIDNADNNALPSCSTMSGTILSSSIEAQATVKNGCELVSVDPLDFGSKSPATSSQLRGDATAKIAIRCPVNTNFTVALGEGMHNNGTSRQVCQGSSCVSYNLYQDAGHTTPWNDSDRVQNQTSTTGNDQLLTVYGNIPAQNWPAAGTYTDTVVVTLSY
ncbi:spore coat U domain-containing protein [Klebsiella quasipneumoniae]|uniref:Csu type fimbrial protein n=1 Tax=Klebsiella quasipneumoniae TaxID=1463165 RepID=UPI001CA9C981|nr:spore coat U domain-containing protein [Klebsiella quasipneumoniae]HBQ2879691.1 spore coat U domain-containing protein [Klebsiella quasipneumoniae subsp. quasipneumoniae]MCH9290561.1 spore coat U domain-containing protein [Klebsiella quasipneumoniae]MCH9295958.1 spore coat U domain-containing protein [Klebsiella quasipneumoniae]MDI3216861.1 spore coat U domain-containing protein [Klebsiella quasipneumoniae]UAA16420.1 spore coat U domain-containing protein [Klebsiella quasipneumoniae]